MQPPSDASPARAAVDQRELQRLLQEVDAATSPAAARPRGLGAVYLSPPPFSYSAAPNAASPAAAPALRRSPAPPFPQLMDERRTPGGGGGGGGARAPFPPTPGSAEAQPLPLLSQLPPTPGESRERPGFKVAMGRVLQRISALEEAVARLAVAETA